jgi:hypothetical protein
MLDFKAQLHKDMEVFHNPGEFATETKFWYDGEMYEVPLVFDKESVIAYKGSGGYHAEGINEVEAIVYIAHKDVGFVPRKDHSFEIEIAGAVETYNIIQSDYEDGEIILRLGAFGE